MPGILVSYLSWLNFPNSDIFAAYGMNALMLCLQARNKDLDDRMGKIRYLYACGGYEGNECDFEGNS